VDVTQRGEWPGDGVPWEGGTESGEGLLRTVVVNDNAGFSNGGGVLVLHHQTVWIFAEISLWV
jgi:hypothetical protein